MPETATVVVAKIDKDWLFETLDVGEKSEVGREFHYGALAQWWDMDDMPDVQDVLSFPNIRFRLYDDDKELYYEGFLYDDPGCVVQQFVLKWAEADSGCTTIMVKRGQKWVQDIG